MRNEIWQILGEEWWCEEEGVDMLHDMLCRIYSGDYILFMEICCEELHITVVYCAHLTMTKTFENKSVKHYIWCDMKTSQLNTIYGVIWVCIAFITIYVVPRNCCIWRRSRPVCQAKLVIFYEFINTTVDKNKDLWENIDF